MKSNKLKPSKIFQLIKHTISKFNLKGKVLLTDITYMPYGNNQDAFIHSDQGAHYTSPKFQKLLKKNRLGQSMSRRGNCWDNSPQESFFGHMKDEIVKKADSCSI